MPDWISHVIIALIFCEIFSVKKKSLMVFGALLPDILNKLSLISFFMRIPDGIFIIFESFHTPAMILIFTVLITPFFRYDKIKVFSLILFGAFTHIAADLMTNHFIGGQMLFFPFSFANYNLGLLWPEQFYIVLIASISLYILIVYTKKYLYKKRSSLDYNEV